MKKKEIVFFVAFAVLLFTSLLCENIISINLSALINGLKKLPLWLCNCMGASLIPYYLGKKERK